MLQVSQQYANKIQSLEGIKGQITKSPGLFTWYFDNIGVATVGWGYALVDTAGNHIRNGQANVVNRAAIAMKGLFGSSTATLQQLQDLKTKTLNHFAADVSAMVRQDTTQAQFDALVDFAYNVGTAALKGSTLLKMHNSKVAVLGSQDLKTLAADSKGHKMATIGDAFAAWSNADHQWSLGVFHRRMWEFLIYSGAEMSGAYSTAFAFKI